MADRLPAQVEATAIMRRVQAEGGFAAVLKKGDPDRGALMLLLRQRGDAFGLLERVMGPDFDYHWSLTETAGSLADGGIDILLEKRLRLDADFWLIELDIAEPERFIAETISSA